MKKKMILFTAALAVSLCVSTAIYAEDHGLGIADGIRSLLSDEEVQNALFGEEGLINEILPEGTDLQTVEEQIALVESQGSQILDALQSKIDSAGSSLVGLHKGFPGRLPAEDRQPRRFRIHYRLP